MKFRVDEIVKATGGRLLAGSPESDAGCVCTDTRQMTAGQTFLALRGERFDGHDFLAQAAARGVACLVVDREDRVPAASGGGPAVVLVRDTLAALADLGRAARARLACPVLAVTGSCGKTTVKEMLGQVLAQRMTGRTPPASFNNQIGVPLTLLGAEPDDEFVLCEFGTNAPGEIATLVSIGRPTIGIVTCVAEVHLAGLGSIEGVAREKGALVEGLSPEGVAILNADDPHVARMAQRRLARGGRVVRVGFGEAADLKLDDLIQTDRGLHFTVGGEVGFDVPVLGAHQALLAGLAAAAAREVGVPLEETAEALRRFQPPPMRLARVELGGNVILLNDCYNANVLSLAAALDLLALWPDRRKVFFCGDMLEIGAGSREAHVGLGRRAAEAGVNRLICVGIETRATAEAAVAAGMKADAVSTFANSVAAAVAAPAMVDDGDVVLVKGSRGTHMERVIDAILGVRKAGGDRPHA